MPQMGADMTEGTVIKWLKSLGDHIERGDILAEIETDKATVELEAYESGELVKIVANEGDVVPVGELIALLGAKGESTEDGASPLSEEPKNKRTRISKAPPEKEADESEPDEEEAGDRPTARPARGKGDRVRISPVARRIADDNDLDVSGIKGSGPDGRILRRDVEDALNAKPSSKDEAPEPAQEPETVSPSREKAPASTATGEVVPLTRIRTTIARRMLASKQNQPHYYLTVDVDMDAALTFRKSLNEAASEVQKVSINDLIVKACALALERHPKFTAQFTDEGLRYAEQLDINIGIALDEGLIAPAILDCGRKSLGRIAEEAKELVARAREGKLRSDEYVTGCFTITNLGAYGVESLIGIINPPQASILGVGSVMAQPVVRDGQLAVGQVMKLALSADHRVSDGAEGARFIKELQGLLENPVSLAL